MNIIMTLWKEFFDLLYAPEGIPLILGINLSKDEIMKQKLPQNKYYSDKMFVFLDEPDLTISILNKNILKGIYVPELNYFQEKLRSYYNIFN